MAKGFLTFPLLRLPLSTFQLLTFLFVDGVPVVKVLVVDVQLDNVLFVDILLSKPSLSTFNCRRFVKLLVSTFSVSTFLLSKLSMSTFCCQSSRCRLLIVDVIL